MYKSQLQEFVQKSFWPSPVYYHTRQGFSHHPKFKASVEVNGKCYESPESYLNLKAAEHAAAKVALESLGATKDEKRPNSGLCKNLLQEYAQKSGLSLPIYRTERSGEDHSPVFMATVEVGNMFYVGGAAKNKKEAEAKAANVALIAIQKLAIVPTLVSDDRKPSQKSEMQKPDTLIEKKRSRQSEDVSHVSQQRMKLLCSSS